MIELLNNYLGFPSVASSHALQLDYMNKHQLLISHTSYLILLLQESALKSNRDPC